MVIILDTDVLRASLGLVVENQPSKAGDTGWIPGPRRSYMPRATKTCAITIEPAL